VKDLVAGSGLRFADRGNQSQRRSFSNISRVSMAYLFSPGIFWSGLSLNRSGWEVQHLQMYS
jgi:hypothetical protein